MTHQAENVTDGDEGTIDVGSVDEVYVAGDETEADLVDALDYYVHVNVEIDEVTYSVACGVGICASDQGSARASGAGSCYGGGPNVWWVDSSDWEQMDSETADRALEALEEVAERLFSEAREICEEARDERRSKENVRSWDTVTTYVATFDNGKREGACDVEVQIGEAYGAWFLRTADKGGGADDAEETTYDSEDEARDAAEEFAADRHEGEDGEDAQDYLARQLQKPAGEPSEDGEWCVYWSTTGDDDHVVDMYATQDQAEAAAEIANTKLRVRHPGALLCGYEVRRLVDGDWVSVEEDAA